MNTLKQFQEEGEKFNEEWVEFVESQVWQGEDEYTKNMAVGNVAVWWIDKINQQTSLAYELGKKEGQEKYICHICKISKLEEGSEFCSAIHMPHALKLAKEKGKKEGQEEYKQFILNILDGVDIADGECNTKAIRHAIQSRLID